MKSSAIKHHTRLTLPALLLAMLAVGWGTANAAGGPAAGTNDAAPVRTVTLTSQGLQRVVRIYEPAARTERSALVIALHGSRGDGARLRHLTGGAFEHLADRHGFVVAYPDALGGQWNDCRARAPYRGALQGVDDVGFLNAVVERAAAETGRRFDDVFAVGYSNGGHMVFRLALEAPQAFTAFAAIGAHLPVSGELACEQRGEPVSIMLVSGVDDPINPWSGGELIAPGGVSLGHVLSAEGTADFFRGLADLSADPEIERLEDTDPQDGTRVSTRRWRDPAGPDVALMAVEGGGHSLPHPTAPFPAEIVGATSRDVDGAALIYGFFDAESGDR